MRVIAGTYRSRTLQAPPGLATRPTSDRRRETLFNVLAAHVQGAVFLDLYAGSGAVGIEALSRGAAHVVFVERASAAVKILRTNLARLAITAQIEIETGTVDAFLRRAWSRATRFDLIFLDPPYDAAGEYENSLNLLGEPAPGLKSRSADAVEPVYKLTVDGAFVIAEHRRKVRLQDQYGALTRTRLLEQGDGALSFFQRN